MTHFTVVDPGTFDGDPFEVAERAVRQAGAVAEVLVQTLEGTLIMARNAELERQLIANDECSVLAWENSAQARKLDAALEDAERVVKDCKLLAQAAGFNPKAR